MSRCFGHAQTEEPHRTRPSCLRHHANRRDDANSAHLSIASPRGYVCDC
ncbi:hypothetical protein chiPu_0008663, partial [Chiloscyllium punctatum]|nr:hypothetical protein [Chiloscyllium punctatum]